MTSFMDDPLQVQSTEQLSKCISLNTNHCFRCFLCLGFWLSVKCCHKFIKYTYLLEKEKKTAQSPGLHPRLVWQLRPIHEAWLAVRKSWKCKSKIFAKSLNSPHMAPFDDHSCMFTVKLVRKRKYHSFMDH